ncbi:hypothetical protein R1flu_013151 [Riccia fluitans]|uniref:Uncharacterized protein n=1 Tax=Riccia fluitans TaxID=41844 RepID=A0ABD1XDT8_9MARC
MGDSTLDKGVSVERCKIPVWRVYWCIKAGTEPELKMDMKINTLNGTYPPPKYNLHILEPVQVHVFVRHGDRSPSLIHKARMDTDLWLSRVQERPPELPGRTDYKHQEFPWGQLTKKGKEQAIGLGQWLRKYYFDTLKIFDNFPSSVHFRSTNYERTHLTGWYVLNGLLGSSKAAASIPVDIRGEKDETLMDTGEYRRVSTILKEHMDAVTKPVKQPDGTYKPSEIGALFEKVKVGISSFLALEPNTRFNWLVMILVSGKFSFPLVLFVSKESNCAGSGEIFLMKLSSVITSAIRTCA